jgi:hypothetical protein
MLLCERISCKVGHGDDNVLTSKFCACQSAGWAWSVLLMQSETRGVALLRGGYLCCISHSFLATGKVGC